MDDYHLIVIGHSVGKAVLHCGMCESTKDKLDPSDGKQAEKGTLKLMMCKEMPKTDSKQ
jgi:hypothetical protein